MPKNDTQVQLQEIELSKRELLEKQQGFSFLLDTEGLDLKTKYWLQKALEPIICELQQLTKLRQEKQRELIGIRQELEQVEQEYIQQKYPIDNGSAEMARQTMETEKAQLQSAWQEGQETFENQWGDLLDESVSMKIPVLTLDQLEACRKVIRNQQGEITEREQPSVRILMQLDFMIQTPESIN